MKEPELFRKEFHTQPVVLVDGITRTGKSMLGPILTSFKGVELERLELVLEKIATLYGINKIKKDAAVSLLRLEVQRELYESMLSRNTNFRFGDHSGVFRQVNPLRYVKRLFMKEGDIAMERIKKEKPIFQVMQHDVLGDIKIYFAAFGDRLRVLEMLRHPVDVIHSLYRRKYGDRESHDPRHLSFTIKYKGKLLPVFCHGWEEEYLNCHSTMDRVIKLYALSSKRLWQGYNQLTSKQKRQVLFIPFEKFVTHPQHYIPQIEIFIGRKATKYTKKALKKANCPRILNNKERKKKEREIQKLTSEEYIKIMEKLSKEHEKKIINL